jgi:hypothetical protein
MHLKPRKRILVDAKLQGRLVLRVAAYWFLSLLAVGLMLVTWDIAQGLSGPYFEPGRAHTLWYTTLTMAVASVLLLPVLLADTLLFSNRFAGPLYRVRKQMRALTAGEPVEPIEFRKKDDLAGLAEEFNALVAYVERLKQQPSTAPAACENQPRREPDRPGACPTDGKPAPLVDTGPGQPYVESFQGVS